RSVLRLTLCLRSCSKPASTCLRRVHYSPRSTAEWGCSRRGIFKIDPVDILHAKVVGTIVAGRFVWRDPFFA
ncbi:MAG TPA: hypothetical protein VJG32_16180, partial [Anaerolineae bacterium]|nr:hypothetical protein [Anaerolineae bacterium]